VTKTLYNQGVRTSKVIEKLGTHSDLERRFGTEDTIQKAKDYVKELTRQEKAGQRVIIVKYSPTKQIAKDEMRLFSGGYLFLQRIYRNLGLEKICRKIEEKYKFDFDLHCVLSSLVYSRIIFPASKLATHEHSKQFMQPPCFEIQHMYRGLEVMKQYGKGKENRPNPIVQMGLFMNGDGIPLAFSINEGNTNEQVTLT